MSRRLKVLISAYACEPHKGSEPEVGWQWGLQMARFHDVTVLTRANNRPVIEEELRTLRDRQPLPKFVYHDRGGLALDIKRRARAIQLYYVLWQKSARELVVRLHEANQFDLMHHVTFAGFRYPIAIWGHGVPTVWGPIGGIESIPLRLLPWKHPRSLLREGLRNLSNVVQATPIHVLPNRARATSLILASTPEMQRAFTRLGFESTLMPAIGLHTAEMPRGAERNAGRQLQLLFVGNIITLKGVDLAIEALKKSGTDALLTLVGDGNYLPVLRQSVRDLGLQDRVIFNGRLARQEVLRLYSHYDVFVFPSLHDTGGYAVIEAMCNQLPVICLDCGGPAVAVKDGCGVRVPVGKRKAIVEGLAEAFRRYAQNPGAARAEGAAARQSILENYDWARKGERMNQFYLQAVERFSSRKAGTGAKPGYSGMSSATNLLHGLLSAKGFFVALLALMLIGTLGFISIETACSSAICARASSAVSAS